MFCSLLQILDTGNSTLSNESISTPRSYTLNKVISQTISVLAMCVWGVYKI
jgi:hypothetical protein